MILKFYYSITFNIYLKYTLNIYGVYIENTSR